MLRCAVLLCSSVFAVFGCVVVLMRCVVLHCVLLCRVVLCCDVFLCCAVVCCVAVELSRIALFCCIVLNFLCCVGL